MAKALFPCTETPDGGRPDPHACLEIGACTGVPSAAFFEFFGLLPIPLKAIVSASDWRWLALSCDCGLFAVCYKMCFVTGRMPWTVYMCARHERVHSLLFLARRVVLRNIFEQCVRGTRFDTRFRFYRQELSKLSTRYLYYVGSVFVNGVHLVYYTNYVGVRGDRLRLLQDLHNDDVYVCQGLDDCCVILVCRECASLSEEAVSACLNRQRWLMQRYLSALPGYCRYSCGEFRSRDKLLETVASGEPVLKRVFISRCFLSADSRRPARDFYFP